MSKESRFTGKHRYIVFISLLSVSALFLLIRYAYVMFGTMNTSPNRRTELISGRGLILDRNGRALAMEVRTGNITLWRPSMRNPDNTAELANELAPILEMPARVIQERIDNSRSNFLYLQQFADETTIRLIQAELAAGRLQGVGIEPMVNRFYPEGSLASQIIGYTSVNIQNSDELSGRITATSREGIEGIEYLLNNELSPSLIPSLTGARRYQNGNQVYLTLDINVQLILENIANRVLTENRAEAVMFMAMDPRTGDILGSVSLPGFDPNELSNSNEITRMDRPSIWSYEPGSVFKVYTLAALMDEGAITGNTIFNCNGMYERVTPQGGIIQIGCLGNHGRVTARDIIIHSCNAGAAEASEYMSAPIFNEILREFGFGSRTGLGTPGETAGFFRAVERWTERSKPIIAMGQEIAVSALQMIQAATAIANDGVLVPPRIVSRIVSAEGESRAFESGRARQVLKPETARSMRDYMTDVTSAIGTGWRANIDDISMAVKTGTAQMYDPNRGGYSQTDFIASCIAFLPAENPSLILYLAIIRPQGDTILAGRIAAPPIREAAEELVNYLGIPRGRNPQIVHPGAIIIPPVSFPVIGENMADFTGLSKRQLLPLLLRDDLNLRITGDGWVRRQSPPPGTALRPDTLIILELE